MTSIATVFDDHPVTFTLFRGEPVVPAREIGAAMGYAGRGLQDLIGGPWSGDFEEGKDYHLLTGEALAEFKAASRDSSGIDRRVDRSPSLLLLTETGLYAVALKTDKALGVRLRRFLAREVLPKLARGEAVGSAPKLGHEERAEAREYRILADRLRRTDPARAHALYAKACAVLGVEAVAPPKPASEPPVVRVRPTKHEPMATFLARLVKDPDGQILNPDLRAALVGAGLLQQSIRGTFPPEVLTHLRSLGGYPGWLRMGPKPAPVVRMWSGVRLVEP
jgi:prophage antirepressor-like protein